MLFWALYFYTESLFLWARIFTFKEIRSLKLVNRGDSVKPDLAYPLHKFLRRNFYLYSPAQYENALEEKLLDFKEGNETLRLGFAFAR